MNFLSDVPLIRESQLVTVCFKFTKGLFSIVFLTKSRVRRNHWALTSSVQFICMVYMVYMVYIQKLSETRLKL